MPPNNRRSDGKPSSSKPRHNPYSRPKNPATKAPSKPKKATAPYIPYRARIIPKVANLYFNKTQDWDPLRLIAGIYSHIDSISTVDLNFRTILTNIHCGNSDNGNGGSLTSAAIERLSLACPNLKDFTFEAATQLNDSALIALVTNCPDIKRISISGHDKRNGSITAAGLKSLQQNKKIRILLVHLELTDQGMLEKASKALSKARKGLAIHLGETEGDGYAAQMVASMTGGGYANTYFGRKLAGDDGDDGSYSGGDSDFGGYGY